jgi:energy-coupling factor transporter ATP-binding protein EcfA2
MTSASIIDDPNFWDCLDRLPPDNSPVVNALVEAAFSADPEALDLALELGEAEERGERPQPTEPPPMYLTRIAVQGFRGIGEQAVLELPPGPGLTVVTGRNGSGKSSFAEALELVLTGSSARWEKGVRSDEMKGGWRNLHCPAAPGIEVSTVGSADGVRLALTWPADATEPEAGTFRGHVGGQVVESRAALGWADVLSVYLPILTYAGLGDLTASRDVDLYDQLVPMLGLGTLRSAQQRLATFRKALEENAKAARARWNQELKPAVEALAAGPEPDARATDVLEAMRRRPWDVEAVAARCEGTVADDTDAVLRALEALQPPDVAALTALAAELEARIADRDARLRADTGQSAELVGLLEAALRVRGGEPQMCPVCGEGALDDAWRLRTEEALDAARASIAILRVAEQDLVRLTRDARSHLSDPPPVLARASELELSDTVLPLWERFAEGRHLDDPRALVAHLRTQAGPLAAAVQDLITAAEARREGRDASWRPVARDLAAWLPSARRAVAARSDIQRVKQAESTLRDVSRTLLAERFEPIEQQMKAIWERLRQRSHVELETVALMGTHRSTKRGVALEVTVDGAPNVALGVMSQGELHSLALSLFLPRLTHADSPFRFVVLDDPVQAMDPYKVDGLARVLEDVARTRQVVVFTHDARLPESIRRLRIDATLLRVERGPRSSVTVRPDRDPVEAYLEEAYALSRSADKLGPKATQRVVPVFCRGAIEAFFKAAYRRRALGDGVPFDEVERIWASARGTVAFAALGLFGDLDRGADVAKEVNRLAGPSSYGLLKACKEGAHEGWDRLHAQRVADVRSMLKALQRGMG